MQIDTVLIDVLHIHECSAPVLTKFHYIANKFRRRVDMRIYHRLFRRRNSTRIGEICRVVDIFCFTACKCDLVDNRRRCGDKIEVILPFKAFLYYFHVEKSQKAASETEA